MGKKKSPLMIYAINVIKDTLRRMEDDGCDEEKLIHVLSRLNAEEAGKFDANSFVTYDKAMRMLNIGNRNTLQTVLKKHNVNQYKINNVTVGFLKTEVEAVAALEKRPPIKKRRVVKKYLVL